MPKHRDLVALAERVAERAAGFVRAADRPSPDAWDRKAQADFVTAIDRESERMIRKDLLTACPDSAVMGEELGSDDPGMGLVWIVDPLDGTTNYLHGFPAYAVSIGIRLDGALVGGVVVDVDRGVCYSACSALGARRSALVARPSALGARRPERARRASVGSTLVRSAGSDAIYVSSVSDPAHALIGTGFPFKEPALQHLERWNREFMHVLGATSGVRRAGSAALDLVSVACGQFDGFWEYGLAAWDLAAGAVLVREAGGSVTDLEGNDLHAPPAHGPIVAGNPAIHAWLLKTLRNLDGH